VRSRGKPVLQATVSEDRGRLDCQRARISSANEDYCGVMYVSYTAVVEGFGVLDSLSLDATKHQSYGK
jgi:hypothetical protein